jgi:NAD(P)-dependent dehydrogenase (short-subunit alcohol dehydrogenase family)
MPKTVLITGTSSGIGKAAALYFAQQGWNVAATLRNPAQADFQNRPNIKTYTLDVTDNDSIQRAIADTLRDFGSIDVVVNNAGYGVSGVFEGMSDDVIERQFNTNVFGLMRVTRAIIPHFRENNGGTLIQVTSMGGRITFPLFSLYHGSKWAVEGFSESLQYELAPFNIHVKIVEPGPIKTKFYEGNREFTLSEHLPMYAAFVQQVARVTQDAEKNGEPPELVAKTIFQAACDRSARMRYPVGYPAPLLLRARRWLGDRGFFAIIKRAYRL